MGGSYFVLVAEDCSSNGPGTKKRVLDVNPSTFFVKFYPTMKTIEP